MKCIFLLLLVLCFSCSQKLQVKSYPSGAQVKVIDLAGDIEKVMGNTPINLKVEKGFGSMFFLELSMDKYRTKKVLVSSIDGTNIKIDTKLEVLEDYNKRLKQAVNNVSNQQKFLKDFLDKEEAINEAVENKQEFLNKLEIELALYKAMLFDKKYSKGIANYDKKRLEVLVNIIAEAKELELKNQITDAIKVLNKALEIDSTNTYINNYLASLYKINKNEAEAKNILDKLDKLNTSFDYNSLIQNSYKTN